ncbi:MAG: hypothetical protein HY976_01625 [Candidatus Kerfeldbacteria bacterium]|nr:hypothetical protein [Candidatus Kerfeldbacteria bacterium]
MTTLQQRVYSSPPRTISGVSFDALYVAVTLVLDELAETSIAFADRKHKHFGFRMACIEFWMLEVGVASKALQGQPFADNWLMIERTARLSGVRGLVRADRLAPGEVITTLRQAADAAAKHYRVPLDLQTFRQVTEDVLCP